MNPELNGSTKRKPEAVDSIKPIQEINKPVEANQKSQEERTSITTNKENNQAQNEKYQQLDMFQEAGVQVESTKDKFKNEEKIAQYNRKGEMLEKATKALEAGNTQILPESEIEVLQLKLPGFVEEIDENLTTLENEAKKPASDPSVTQRFNALKVFREKAVALRDKLFNQEAETEESGTIQKSEEVIKNEKAQQTEEEKNTAKREQANIQSRIESNLENLESYEQIIDKINEVTKNLADLMQGLNGENLSVVQKEALRIRIEYLLKQLEDLIEKLENKKDNFNDELLNDAREIQARIQELENSEGSESEIARLQETLKGVEIQINKNTSDIQSFFIDNGKRNFETIASSINLTTKDGKKESGDFNNKVKEALLKVTKAFDTKRNNLELTRNFE